MQEPDRWIADPLADYTFLHSNLGEDWRNVKKGAWLSWIPPRRRSGQPPYCLGYTRGFFRQGSTSMRHWTLLGEAAIPDTGNLLTLYRGKDDFFIKIRSQEGGRHSGGPDLMNSRQHGSEDALGTLPCERIAGRAAARVLIGGLGMGFTLAAALRALGPDAEVTVAELIPEVVEWNRGPLGEPSGWPLNDTRTRVFTGDVARLVRDKPASYDAIALDIDNGPEGLTSKTNDWLYSQPGISAACRALRPGGVLAYWSAGPDRAFARRLRLCGLKSKEFTVHAHGRKGPRHTIWLANP